MQNNSESMCKCDKSWETMLQAEKVCFQLKKHEKVCLFDEKVQVKLKNNSLVRTLSAQCCLSICWMLHSAKLYSPFWWESVCQTEDQLFSAHIISWMLWIHMLNDAFCKFPFGFLTTFLVHFFGGGGKSFS